MKLNRNMLRKLILKEILSEQIESRLKNNDLVAAVTKAAQTAGVSEEKISAYANPQGPDISINIAGYESSEAAKEDLDKMLNDKVNLPAELHTQFESAVIDPAMTGTGKFNIHFLIS